MVWGIHGWIDFRIFRIPSPLSSSSSWKPVPKKSKNILFFYDTLYKNLNFFLSTNLYHHHHHKEIREMDGWMDGWAPKPNIIVEFFSLLSDKKNIFFAAKRERKNIHSDSLTDWHKLTWIEYHLPLAVDIASHSPSSSLMMITIIIIIINWRHEWMKEKKERKKNGQPNWPRDRITQSQLPK